jgi:hypothetical protein
MTMTATMTSKAQIQASIDELGAYRRNLRSEARRTVDEKSRVDRLAEVDRVTRQIGRLYSLLGDE